MEVLKGKLEEFDTKLAQALSVVMTRDEELVAIKKNLEHAKQVNFNLSFDDAEHSAAWVIKEAKVAGYFEGWIAALDAIYLPLTSPFRDLSKVPLSKDPPVEEVQQEGQAREGEDSPSFRKLLEEIEAHTTNIDVIIVEIPNPPVIA